MAFFSHFPGGISAFSPGANPPRRSQDLATSPKGINFLQKPQKIACHFSPRVVYSTQIAPVCAPVSPPNQLRKSPPEPPQSPVSSLSNHPPINPMKRSRIPLNRTVPATRAHKTLSLAKACAAVLAGFSAPVVASAASYYWAGDNGNLWNQTAGLPQTNWSLSPDFNSSSGLVLPGSADDVYFNLANATNLTTELGQSFSINSLNFNSNAANPVIIQDTPGTHTLTIGAGGVTDSGSSVFTVSTNVTLGANQTWRNTNTSNAMIFSGPIGGSGINLTLAGGGGFNLTGINTYSGTTSLVTAGTALTLSGSNGSLATSSISLDGGTTLNIDNTSGSNADRIGNSTGITSRGGTIALKGTSATETVGVLNLTTGDTRVNVDAGSTLTLNGALTHTAGGAVNFSPTGSTFITGQTNAAGGTIIGGYATIGNIGSVQQDANGGSNVLNFASISGGQVVPLASYDLNDFSSATKNTKVDGSVSGGINILTAASTTINSLYLTGNAKVQIGTVGNTAAATLVIGSGGIIVNAATLNQTGAGPQVDLVNSAELGDGIANNTFNVGGGAITGKITSLTNDLVITTASNLRLDSVITDNGTQQVNLVKNGSGTLDLSNGNANPTTSTFTGNTTINGGLLIIKSDRTLGANPTVTNPNAIVLNGGELRMTATIVLNSNRGITVGPQGGTISYNGGNSTQLTGFLVTGSGSLTYSDIPSFGLTASNINACAMNVGFGTTNYQGSTTFFTQGSNNTHAISAVIYFGGSNKVPDTSDVTVTNNDGKGVLNLNGASDVWGSLAGNGTIVNDITTITSNLTVGQSNLSTNYSGVLGKTGVTFSVGGNVGSGDNTSNAGQGAGATNSNITLAKIGAGTLTLSGANQYTGATKIGTNANDGGKILVTGSLANSPVTVGDTSGHSGSLGGSGTIAGPVTVNASGSLAPAINATSTSHLTISNNLTLNSGASLNFNFGATGGTGGTLGTSDTVIVNGAGQLSLPSSLTLNITPLTGFGIGTYEILDNTSNATQLTPSTTNWAINGSNTFNYAFVVGTGSNTFDASLGGGVAAKNAIFLEVLQGNPAYFWTGAVNGNWNLSTANWTSLGSGSIYQNASNVTFDDGQAGLVTPSTSSVTVQAAGVSPNSITFGNASLPYTFGGTGAITVTGAAGISKSQSGSVAFNVDVTTPQLAISGGSVTIGSSNSLTATNASNAVTVTGGSLTVNGAVNTDQLKVSAGGTATIASGALLSPHSASSVTASVNGTLNLSNGTQSLGGLSGAGSVALTSTALTLTGNSSFDGTLSGNGSLVVNAPSSIVSLSNGASNFSGGTTITNGTLNLTNTSGSATGSGAVLVQPNGTFGGTGFATGAVTLNGTLAPGGAGVIGTLTLGSLTANASSIESYDLASPGSGDLAHITGAASYAGSQTLNITAQSGFGIGSWTLATADGGLTDTATITVGTVTGPGAPTGGLAAVISYNVVQQGNNLVLNATVPTVTWTGANSNAWDIETTPNWKLGVSTANYVDGESVIFDDTGTNTNPINVAAAVSPTALLFNNTTATAYSFAGSSIGGGSNKGLTMNGNGTVTLSAGNTYTGGTHLNAGTLIVPSDTGLGAVPASVDAHNIELNGGTLSVTTGTAANLAAGNATLNTNRGIFLGTNGGTLNIGFVDSATGSGNIGSEVAFVYNGQITGGSATSTFVISGQAGAQSPSAASILDLGTAQTYLGNTTINNAIVQVNSGTTGPGTGANITNVLPATTVLNLINNGVYNMDAGLPTQTVAGLTGDSSGRVSTSNASNAAPFTINPATGQTYNFAGSIQTVLVRGKAGSNDKISVTIGGDGTQIFSGANLYNGGTTMSGTGTLQLAGAGTLGATTSGLTVNSGTVDLNGTNQGVGNLSGGGGTITNTGNANSVLTIGNGNAGAGAFAGAITNGNTNNVAVTKTGTGTIALSGANTYSGATTVNNGTLIVSGSLSASTTTTVNTGATLASGNNITSSVGPVSLTSNGTGGGTLAPGTTVANNVGLTSIGELTVHGNLTLGVAATAGLAHLQIELGGGGTLGAGGGTMYDQVTVTGAGSTVNLNNVNLDGGLVNSFGNPPTNQGLFTTPLPAGDEFFIIINQGGSAVNGTFANATSDPFNGGLPSVVLGGQLFDIYYSANSGTGALTGGTDVALVSAVPEPGSFATIISGLGMLLGLQRFRRRS